MSTTIARPSSLPASALKVLYHLDDNAAVEDGRKTIQLSAFQIGESLGMQRRQATRALRRLETDGYITIYSDRDERGHLPNRYTLVGADPVKRRKLEKFADESGLSRDEAIGEVVRVVGKTEGDTDLIPHDKIGNRVTIGALVDAGILRADPDGFRVVW